MSNDTNQTTVREDSIPVLSGGRITIPDDIREEYGLIPRSIVQVRLLLDNDDEDAVHFNRRMTKDGKVTIPSHIRTEHDILPGHTVDVEIGVLE